MEETTFVYNPDQEFIDFANYFSENYKSLKSGHYISKGNKYQVFYFRPASFKGVRVSHKTGVIEMDARLLKNDKVTPDFVFYLMIWCRVSFNLGKIQNEMLVDKTAIDYYLKTGRPTKNIVLGMEASLGNDFNAKTRLQNIVHVLGKETESNGN